MIIYLINPSTGVEATSGKVGPREQQTREGHSTGERCRDDVREQ